MMTTYFRADCPQCGPVRAAMPQAHLVTRLADQQPGTVVFTCPICRLDRQVELSRRATRLLLAAGISLVAAPTDGPVAQAPGSAAAQAPGSAVPPSRSALPQTD